MSTIRRLSVGMFLLLLIAPAAATAASKTVPPGHSGASQYTETVPTAGGEKTTNTVHGGTLGGGGDGKGGGGSTSSPTLVLGAENAKRLEKLGPEGKAAARLAAAGGTSAHKSGGTGHHGDGAAGSGGSSPLKQVAGELTGTSGSSGMGLLLPLLILATAMVAFGFVLSRRRPTGTPE
ncbi:MAG: hypothetical protein QM729_12315 [Solirubrobacterales bacterium]